MPAQIITNKIIEFKESELFWNDFDIIKIKKIDRTQYIDTFELLKKPFNTVFSSENYIYILVKKGTIDLKNDIGLRKNVADISYTKDVPNLVLLNLIYQNEMRVSEATRAVYGGNSLINGRVFRIVKTGEKSSKKQIVTLNLRISKDNAGDYMYIDASIQTFTPISNVPRTCFNKSKNSTYIQSKKFMLLKKHSKEELEKNKDSIYIPVNGTKFSNSYVSLTFDSEAENSKLGKIYYDLLSPLENSKYIEILKLENMSMDVYKDSKYFKSFFVNNSENYFVNRINSYGGINIITKNIEASKEVFNITESYKKLGLLCKIDSSEHNNLNLVLLNCNKSNENLNDDSFRMSNKDKNEVFQHVGMEKFRETEVKTNCPPVLYALLENLLIKKDLKNKKISNFDWVSWKSETKTEKLYYSFFTVIREKADDNSVNYFYNEMKISTSEDTLGNIFDCKVKQTEPFDDIFELLTPEYLGGVKDSSGNCILLKSTNLFVMPNPDLFKETSEHGQAMDMRITGDKWDSYFNKIERDFPVYQKEIADFRYSNTEIYPGSSVELSFKDFKTKLSRGLKKRLDDLFFKKHGKHLQGQFRNQKALEKNNLSVCNSYVVFNDRYYTLNPATVEGIKKCANNILLKEIEVMEGENFFPELIRMLYVPFVKIKSLTVAPFPFKYLREAIDNSGLIKENFAKAH